MRFESALHADSVLIPMSVVLLLLGVHRSTSADVVWIKGQTTPQFGQIVASTSEQIELRVFDPGQTGRIETITRSQIEQIVVNIDTPRLERLSPDHPTDYRDYAEELASQRSDPSARILAQRLYLIAAAVSNEHETAHAIRDSALAGLISITDSDAERRRLRILQLLLNPEAKPVDDTARSLASNSVSTEQATLMLELIHAIRKENSERAIQLLSSQDNRAVFQYWSDICSLEELDRIARVNRPSKPQLSKLLQVELQVMPLVSGTEAASSMAASSDRRQDWGDFAMQGTGLLGVIPSFENVTSMDPSKSVYREGQWVRPEALIQK